MLKDTINTERQLQQPERVARSLIALRDTLWDTRHHWTIEERSLFYKINSCLYKVELNTSPW